MQHDRVSPSGKMVRSICIPQEPRNSSNGSDVGYSCKHITFWKGNRILKRAWSSDRFKLIHHIGQHTRRGHHE